MKRTAYIHDIRGLAAVCIVLIHTNIFSMDNDIISFLWGHFLKEWTSVFVLISGFLFQLLIEKYKFNKFILSKIKNVIIPYFIISIPAIIIYLLEIKKNHHLIDLPSLMENSYPYIISYFYFTGSHLGALWFIPVLALIFLTSKPLSLLHKNKKIFTASSLISLIIILITSRSSTGLNPILGYVHFLPVYIIGMFICFYKEKIIRPEKHLMYLLIFLIVFSVELTFNLSSSFSTLSKTILFIFLCSYLQHLEEKGIRFRILSYLADISFAMYFLHGYFIGSLQMFVSKKNYEIIQENSFYGITLSIITTIVITSAVYGVYVLLRKLKINSRVVIGS